MFFGPFDMDEGVIVRERPVDNVSYRTGWSSTDIVNYRSSSDFEYLTNVVEKYEDKPLFSKYDERSERKRIVELGEQKYGMRQLFKADIIDINDIVYAFNGSSSSFVLTKQGLFNMSFVKAQDDIHLSQRVFELSLFDKNRKFEKPISASVVPAGCVIEFYDEVVAVKNNQVIELETEPAYSVRTYMNSFRYRNMVGVTKQDVMTIHSLDPFDTYNFNRETGNFIYVGKERYAYKDSSSEEFPF